MQSILLVALLLSVLSFPAAYAAAGRRELARRDWEPWEALLKK